MANTKELAKDNNFKYIPDIKTFYGQINSFYFVGEETNLVGLIRIFFSVNIEGAIIDKLREITKNHRSIGRDGVKMEQGLLVIDLKSNGLDSPNELSEILEKLTRILLEEGAMQSSQRNSDKHDVGIYRIGTKLLILSNDEFAQEVEVVGQQFKRNNGSKLKAYGMTALKMMPGVFVYATGLGIGWFSFIGVYMMLNMGISTFQSHSNMSKKDAYLVLGMVVLGMTLGYTFYTAYGVYKALSTMGMGGFTPYFLASLLQFEVFSQFLLHALSHLLFIGLISFGRIKDMFSGVTETKTVKRKTQRLL